MERDSKQFAMISSIMKASHDAIKAVINNMR